MLYCYDPKRICEVEKIMVSMYFGLPGCGKTTMYAKLAYDAAFKRHTPYDHIYGNIALTGIPNYIQINVNDLGTHMLEKCLILIDEGTVQFDNRDYKNFSKNFVEFFMTHRHYECDIAIFCQSYNGVDKKIRSVCDKLYYLHKGTFTGFYKTKVWRIPYDIIIPDKKDTGSAHLGEIIEGYCKPPLLARLFTPSLKRKKYYPYFDSWEKKDLPALPAERLSNQKLHNRIAINNLDKRIESLPKRKFLEKRKLKILRKNFSKALTSL